MSIRIAERYRLVGQLGQGGMGRVWAARDELLGRDVAVKELVPPPGIPASERADLRERAIREARAIARLDHPNVVRVFDVVFYDSDPWIVMELVPSRSLFDTVRDEGPMPPDQVARIGLGVLAALGAAHRAGLLHRDVKPGNVLLADDGRVVLTDFGLATASGDAGMTSTGVILGSPQYLAPERALDGEMGPATDLWSLGATLYAAVEGRPPYVRSSPMATLAALATELPDPPERAGELRHVLAALLQRDPSRRADAETARRLLVAATAPGTPPPSDLPVYDEPTFASPNVRSLAPPAKAAAPAEPASVAAAPAVPPSTGPSRGDSTARRLVLVGAGAAAALLIAVAVAYSPWGEQDTASPEELAVASQPGTAVAASTPPPSPATSPSGISRPRSSAGAVAPGPSTQTESRKTTAAPTATTSPKTEATTTTGSLFQGVGQDNCLYAPAGGGQIVTKACDRTDTGQLFSLASDGTLRARGKCAEVGGTSNGSLVTLVTCTGDQTQQWSYNASLQLVTAAGDNCLDIPYGKDAEDLAMWVWACVDEDNQKWRRPE
ncbi:serine/threonine protein kinase [Actinoplanes sp. NPDC051851]|uniref:serine/threonine protein kinase n=1 Tax=Actinoplanes sp. NPDC051851 TaxID=3154753 RepID=UPI0034199F64